MADMGKTEIDAVSQETISNLIQSELKQKAKLMGLVQNFPAAKGDDKIKIGRTGSLSADDKAENTAVTAQVLTYATDDLLLDKHKAILVRLEDFANIQSKPDVVNDILSRMASEMALQIDEDIVECLEATSAAAPDHRVAYANAATLGKADLLVARRLLHLQNVAFNECFIGVHPASEANLLAIDDFVHVDKYGSSQGLVNGELGRLYGAIVVMSNVFEELKTVIWHPTHTAFALQQQINFERDRDLPNVATMYLSTAIYGCKTLDLGKRGVLLGTAA